MSKKTDIQWCDSTVNPTMGCGGCPLWNSTTKKCYAGKITTMRAGRPGFPPSFDTVRMFPGRMKEAALWPSLLGRKRYGQPWLNGLPRVTFVSDMSDAMSDGVTFEYLESEIIANVMSEAGRRHQWLWLTKRPKRMAEFSRWLEENYVSWPDNLWAGTSILDNRMLVGIEHLLEVGDENTLRFLSVEPQWENVDLGQWLPNLNWIIQGGEWDAHARPFDLAWAVQTRDQCRQHGVPYFLKQLGSHVVESGVERNFSNGHGDDWSEWPEDLRVREMPIYVGAKGVERYTATSRAETRGA